jgi:hypothetical protein
MATYNPPRVGATSTAIAAVDARELNDGIVERGLARFRQLLCGLRGHDNLMQFEKERLSLQCASCGHESPGWALTEAPPKVVLRGDARRHALVRARLVSAERRIA